MSDGVIECWLHGIKVLSSTKCDYWKGKTCGEVSSCFYKSRVARYQYLKAKKEGWLDDERAKIGDGDIGRQEEASNMDEKEVQNVDDAFW